MKLQIRILFVIIAFLMIGCSVKTRGDLLTGSISIHDNINNDNATKVLNTTKDVNNAADRIKTIGNIFNLYSK